MLLFFPYEGEISLVSSCLGWCSSRRRHRLSNYLFIAISVTTFTNSFSHIFKSEIEALARISKSPRRVSR